MALVEFAREELKRAGLFDKDSDYGGMMGEAVMKMIEQFASEGHSGFSASMAVNLFQRLARYEPLTPLTGEDDEWMDTCGTMQNRRCFSVFKDEDGRAYHADAVVFEEPNGSRFTSADSRRFIEFPYMPKTEIVKVAERP